MTSESIKEADLKNQSHVGSGTSGSGLVQSGDAGKAADKGREQDKKDAQGKTEEVKIEVIKDKFHRAVAIAKGMNPDLLSQAEYDRKLKKFEPDVREAYDAIGYDETTIRAEFEGMVIREEHAKSLEGQAYVGMDPKDAQRNDSQGRPRTMEERLRMGRIAVQENAKGKKEVEAARDGKATGVTRPGSSESQERSKAQGKA